MADHPSQDRRARRSRAVLRAALLDLITERGLNRIAVSDVTKRADVNRSTFYEHYSDVHELAADACTRMFDELIAVIALANATNRISNGYRIDVDERFKEQVASESPQP